MIYGAARFFRVWLVACGLLLSDIPLAAQVKERIAVVDFEVPGDVGVPDAGKIVPRLLLSEFSDKYELVTRTQLQALLNEKNLQVSDLMDASGAKERGKLIPVSLVSLPRSSFLLAFPASWR